MIRRGRSARSAPLWPARGRHRADMASELNQILRQVAAQQGVAALAAALRERPRARLHVSPALSAARPALVAALAAQIERPILYVVGSGEAALRAREDLCVWL